MNFFKIFRKKKYDNIKDYISNKIGNIHLSIPSQTNNDLEIEVEVVKPTKEKPYYILITNGLSKYEMKIPRHVETNSFCELVIYLPADWKLFNPNINYYWPVKSLFEISKMIVNNYEWITFSSVISFKRKVSDNSSYNGFLFITGVDDEAVINEKNISFYSLIPVYKEEISYAKQYGGERLFNDLVENGLVFPPIINIKRNNQKKDFY